MSEAKDYETLYNVTGNVTQINTLLVPRAELVSLRAERDALKAGSERYRWLLDYLVSDSTKHDNAIVEAKTSDELDAVISAAKEQQ